ncbi:MAG: FGGY-family carbohydrate kinase, partial [Acidobacteriaceae bacterium]
IFVPALTGLGAPHWDPHARGAIFGLTRGATRAHLARAALEGITYQVADIVRAMETNPDEANGLRVHELRVDGGASTNDLLMQMQADVLGIPIVRSQTSEATVLGACYLAGLGAGVWSNVGELEQQWSESRRFESQSTPEERSRKLAAWHQAIQRAHG